LDEPSVEALMALSRGLTSFPIVFMIMMIKMIEIIIISTYRIIALQISVPMVFEWSKSGLKRAIIVEFIELAGSGEPGCLQLLDWIWCNWMS
jgi:hypothetical protein